MKTHPVTDLYPLNQEDVDAIAADIKANGQKLPILTLGDGRIVDGRNRYMACQKLGLTPKTECIENGKPLSDEELVTIARSHNGKRRQLSKLQVACITALEWKMLHPGESRGGDRTKGSKSAKVDFGEFARDHGVGERNAKKALAVANWNIELLYRAKEDPRGLEDAYEEYREEFKESKLRTRRENIVRKHEDLFERYQAGVFTLGEAVTVANRRNAEREEDERTELSQAEEAVRRVNGFLEFRDTLDHLDPAVRRGLITEEQLEEWKVEFPTVLGRVDV